ncbi:MAG: hypothetical protein LUI06_09510 [Ruminococcus sp.]|nr:hypothetical protein [Ruminococcus sp.]
MKMYLKITKNNIRKHLFINLLIILQLAAVFVLGVMTISAIEEKLRSYQKLEPLLDGDGIYCGGYFLNNEDGDIIESTDEIKENLKNIDFISTVNFTNLQTTDSGNMSVQVFVYDDYAANLFVPETKDGVWITDSDNSGDIAKAVITANSFGYEVGDVVSFEGEYSSINVEIVGIIADNEEYLAKNRNFSDNEQNYKSMLSRHFNLLRDELENNGLSDEGIKEYFEMDGYEPNEVVYNMPVLFFLDSEWEKTGEQDVMSDSLFIKYNDNITDDEKLFNRKYISENLQILDFEMQISKINQNSIKYVYDELYTIFPIMIAALILVLVGSVSVNAINSKTNLKNYSVLYLCGAKKRSLMTISVIYNTFICFISLVISLIAFAIIYSIEAVVIKPSVWGLLVCIAIFALYILVSCVTPCALVRTKTLSETLKSDNE